jgi:hypothetical protein
MTPESSIAQHNVNPPTTLGPDREIRFAVVMYGRVSLAIYINGVAQELLNLVRPTAPKSDDQDETDQSATGFRRYPYYFSAAPGDSLKSAMLKNTRTRGADGEQILGKVSTGPAAAGRQKSSEESETHP